MTTSQSHDIALLHAKQKNRSEEAKLQHRLESLERKRWNREKVLLNKIFLHREYDFESRLCAARARRMRKRKYRKRNASKNRELCLPIAKETPVVVTRHMEDKFTIDGTPPRTLITQTDSEMGLEARSGDCMANLHNKGENTTKETTIRLPALNVKTFENEYLMPDASVSDERPISSEEHQIKIGKNNEARTNKISPRAKYVSLPPIAECKSTRHVDKEFISIHEKSSIQMKYCKLFKNVPQRASRRKTMRPLPMIDECADHLTNTDANHDIGSVVHDKCLTNGNDDDSVRKPDGTSVLNDNIEDSCPAKSTSNNAVDDGKTDESTMDNLEEKKSEKRNLTLPRFMLGNQELPRLSVKRARVPNPLPPIVEYSRVSRHALKSRDKYWAGDPDAIRSVRRTRIPAEEIPLHRWDRVVAANKYMLRQLQKDTLRQKELMNRRI